MPGTARSVVAAVIERQGSYLVCQRPLHKRHGGLWEFPGGKIEEGESFLQAASRELAEELCLQATAEDGLRFSVLDKASGYLINFVDIKTRGEPRLIEHTAMAWLPPAELLQLNLAPSDRQFVEHINEMIVRRLPTAPPMA
jgi:8-oxo-dGTP diphosphatase